MNTSGTYRPGEREFAIQLRSLLLKCVDILERQYLLGKYKAPGPVTSSPTESMAGMIDSAQVNTTAEQSQV